MLYTVCNFYSFVHGGCVWSVFFPQLEPENLSPSSNDLWPTACFLSLPLILTALFSNLQNVLALGVLVCSSVCTFCCRMLSLSSRTMKSYRCQVANLVPELPLPLNDTEHYHLGNERGVLQVKLIG